MCSALLNISFYQSRMKVPSSEQYFLYIFKILSFHSSVIVDAFLMQMSIKRNKYNDLIQCYTTNFIFLSWSKEKCEKLADEKFDQSSLFFTPLLNKYWMLTTGTNWSDYSASNNFSKDSNNTIFPCSSHDWLLPRQKTSPKL